MNEIIKIIKKNQLFIGVTDEEIKDILNKIKY